MRTGDIARVFIQIPRDLAGKGQHWALSLQTSQSNLLARWSLVSSAVTPLLGMA
jgi:hypothetical protein